MFSNLKKFLGFEQSKTLTFTKKGVREMKAFITENNGKFTLTSGGQTIGTYSRRRDAIRGATRRELHVVA